jgi:Tol biopolymer transport system component
LTVTVRGGVRICLVVVIVEGAGLLLGLAAVVPGHAAPEARGSPSDPQLIVVRDRPRQGLYHIGRTRSRPDIYLGQGVAPSISADGLRIAYSAHRHGVTGVEEHVCFAQLDRPIALRDRRCPFRGTSPSISPDGTRIAFASDTDRVYFGDLRTFEAVPGPRLAAPESFSWSADSRSIAVGTDRGIFIVGARRPFHARQVTRSPQDGDPAWRPGTAQLAISRVSTTEPRSSLVLLNLRKRSTKRLTQGREWDSSPSWSADGKTLVFTRAAARRGTVSLDRQEIWIRQLHRTSARRVTRNRVMDASPTLVPSP